MKLSINKLDQLSDSVDRNNPPTGWYALRLLSNYRLFLLTSIAAFFYLPELQTVLGSSDLLLFHSTLIGYLIASIIFNHLIRIKTPNHDTQLYLQVYVDIICITLFTYTSGGVQSGLAVLMIANIAIIGVFTAPKYTFLFAATASLSIIAQEISLSLSPGQTDTTILQTGIAGISLFAVAYITSIVIQKRFPYSFDKDTLREDVKSAEELNQSIIQQMDSGVLVINQHSQIQLINDSAIVLLGLKNRPDDTTLRDISEQLNHAHQVWRSSPFSGTIAFRNVRNKLELLPHFSRLSDHRTLVVLEDYSLISQQVQQLKLASLGRLSASIAHEIRNPLSAISNSVQLVLEDTAITAENKHLLSIAERHCLRINRIIEDILQLSRREKNNPELIKLENYLPTICNALIEQYRGIDVDISHQSNYSANIHFDKSHLQQIISNLCENAITHNAGAKNLKIEVSTQECPKTHAITIAVSDNGKGIEQNKSDDIFEPFYTSDQKGTGLGLFIVRELCEINHAVVNLVPKLTGACFKLQINRAMG